MISISTKLGSYEILAKLGEGGMGEVYRARDTKLNRDVAIKLLPSDVAFDPDRLLRFRREAQVLASLNHANIGAIYGIEESASSAAAGPGSMALVLELVEGPTLADRIAHGCIPLDEALSIARQIGDALDAAHQQGIVHRDLKPANIKLRPDGTVKVLDFGLAKSLDPAATTSIDMTASPTITSAAMTRMGVILGTAAYMSPEQARGRAADGRSDVWAFGCVLYEMLTGERLYRGETTTDVLAAILNRDPDVNRAPPPVRRVLRACLATDARQRLQTLGDAWLLLEDGAPAAPVQRWWRWALMTTLLLLILAVVAATMWMPWRSPIVERQPIQFQVLLAGGLRLNGPVGGGHAISPDGRIIAFVGVSGGLRQLWIRPIESLALRELKGTTGADFPFWSADSRSIGFFAQGKLKRIDIGGGPAMELAPVPIGRGGTWGSDGSIIFGQATGVLRRITADGTVSPLTTLNLANGENAHRWPQFLPDARHFLYYVRSSTPNRSGVYLGSLNRPQDAVLVLANATAGAYAPSGNGDVNLVWARDGKLVAQRFDSESARLTGDATVVAGTEGVGESFNDLRASFSVSQQGTLLFAGAEDRLQLEWFGRNGQKVGQVGAPERYAALRISPDGNRAAVALYDASTRREVWTMELARGLLNPLTTDSGFVPVWSQDGRRIAYHNISQSKLLTVGADGSDPKLVLNWQQPVYINDWSPDGQSLLFTTVSQTRTNTDLWVVPVNGKLNPTPLLDTQFNESHGQYSQDGKWIAFTSDRSGQQEIYISSSDGKDPKRVSTAGGSFARWRHDGTELFYRSMDGRLMAVPVTAAGGHPEFGTPVALMNIVEPLGTYAYPYDITPDGQRILTLKPVEGEQVAPLTVLIHWDVALKR